MLKEETVKIRKWFIGAGAMLLVAVLSLPTSLALANEVTVTLDAPTEVTAGSEFVAPVNISYVENFDAGALKIRFDPAILSLTEVTDGDIGGTNIPVAAVVEKEPGLWGIVANVTGFPGVTGSGYLMEIHFYALASGVSEISLEHYSMSDNMAQLIPATWISNTVKATTSSPSPSASSSPSPSAEIAATTSSEPTSGSSPQSLGVVSWPVSGGIISGVIVVAAAIFIFLRRRRAY